MNDILRKHSVESLGNDVETEFKRILSEADRDLTLTNIDEPSAGFLNSILSNIG